MSHATLSSVHPASAIVGGRVSLHGAGFAIDRPTLPRVVVGDRDARVVFASPSRIDVLVPAGVSSGSAAVRVVDAEGDARLEVGAAVATGLHQVDSPVFDRNGHLFVTYSGTRGQQAPVSIFKVGVNGTREAYSSGVVNPTSMAIDDDGQLFVSSRFEGTVYRVSPDGRVESFATGLGVACGLAFGADGTLFVGDRTGTIFAVDREGRSSRFATLPASVAAFHLAIGADGLFVTGPTLAPTDAVYRIGFDGQVDVISRYFGRPQGIAVALDGSLHVVEALAGASGLFRLEPGSDVPQLVLAAADLIGVTFDRAGGLCVCSSDTAYRLARVI